jgi:hypothetical protein
MAMGNSLEKRGSSWTWNQLRQSQRVERTAAVGGWDHTRRVAVSVGYLMRWSARASGPWARTVQAWLGYMDETKSVVGFGPKWRLFFKF